MTLSRGSSSRTSTTRSGAGKKLLGRGQSRARLHGNAELLQHHLYAGQAAEQLQLVQAPQVSDAERAALHVSEAHTEREVEPAIDVRHERVGVEALGHHHRREGVGELGGVLTKERESPRLHRPPACLGQQRVTREDVGEPLLLQDRDRLAQPEEQHRGRRVGILAAPIPFEHGLPVPVRARATGLLAGGEARSLAARIAMPGGSIRPFCGPVSATSTPQASNLKSIDASDETVSTRSSAGWPARRRAWRTAGTSEVTPVDVSLWTTSTARMSCAWSRSRRACTSAAGTPAPYGRSSRSSSTPNAAAVRAKPAEKKPLTHASTLSPGESVLTIVAPHAPVPEPG